MKKIKNKILVFFVALLLFASVGIVLPEVVGNVTVEAAVTINKKSVTLTKGKSVTLKITGTKNKVYWKSKNTNIATVNSKGKVTAKKAGKTTIIATVSKKQYKCTVTVKNSGIVWSKETMAALSWILLDKTNAYYHGAKYDAKVDSFTLGTDGAIYIEYSCDAIPYCAKAYITNSSPYIMGYHYSIPKQEALALRTLIYGATFDYEEKASINLYNVMLLKQKLKSENKYIIIWDH